MSADAGGSGAGTSGEVGQTTSTSGPSDPPPPGGESSDPTKTSEKGQEGASTAGNGSTAPGTSELSDVGKGVLYREQVGGNKAEIDSSSIENSPLNAEHV